MTRKVKKPRSNIAAGYAEYSWFIRALTTIVCIIATLIFGAAGLAYIFEHNGSGGMVIQTFLDGIWWAIVTFASVGYGDKIPITLPGRVVGMVLILSGIAVMPVFAGLIASVFVEDRMKGAKGLKNITDNHHIVICGWNNSAENMLKALADRMKNDTLVVLVGNYTVDFYESLQGKFPELNLKFVRGETSQEEVLRRANVMGASSIFILADTQGDVQTADDRVVIVANAVHYLAGEHHRITVQLMSGANKNLLLRLGIENILIYDEMGGFLLANNALDKNSINLFENLLRDKKNIIRTASVPPMFVERTFGELFEYYYKHQDTLMVGIYTEQPKLGLQDIFSDDESGIDSFIRLSLEKSNSITPDLRNNIQINPPKDYIIQKNDRALIIS
jgi:voltage-gated potassium channel